jgi:hypothetical protein
MRNRLHIAAIGVTLAAILGYAWYTKANPPVERPLSVVTPSTVRGAPGLSHLEPPSSPQPVTPVVAETVASKFKQARDYAEFAHQIRADAESGKPDAQYYLEETLRYCDQNLTRYFGITSKQRTLDEAQARWARKGPGNSQELMQQEITEVYAHCRVYLEDPAVRPEMQEWSHWLDLAADNGVPPAESLKAHVLLGDYQVAQYSRDPNPTTHVDPAALDNVHELALNALQSGDPRVLWQMADLVGADHPQQPRNTEGVVVHAAWQLLACQRGFDCSANAEWLRIACNQGPTCTPGETGQQFIEQMALGMGSTMDAVKQMASEIGAAVDAKDEAKLPSYLWAKN